MHCVQEMKLTKEDKSDYEPLCYKRIPRVIDNLGNYLCETPPFLR